MTNIGMILMIPVCKVAAQQHVNSTAQGKLQNLQSQSGGELVGGSGQVGPYQHVIKCS